MLAQELPPCGALQAVASRLTLHLVVPLALVSQHVANPVRVHQLVQLRRRAQLLAGRRVMRVCLIWETRRIENMQMAIDLRLFEDDEVHDTND